ncbi:MAG: hypothetical protein GTN40_04315 [Candidatus Aenigmarchaeota archaeon]|nr:hypothetical protein [Candidatus Aenigmarchaeota archaeon]
MVIVFGVEFPVLEFLVILNIIMLIYIVISMFEIRSLIKLRKDLELLIKGGKPTHKPEITYKSKPEPIEKTEKTQ